MRRVSSRSSSMILTGTTLGSAITKACSRCNQRYDSSSANFTRDRLRKDGLNKWCRRCTKDSYVERKRAKGSRTWQEVREARAAATRELQEANEKKCSRCARVLPATPDFFYPRPRDSRGLRNPCKECHKQIGAPTSRNRKLRRNYGISAEDYNALLTRQSDVCAICLGTDDRALSVDHCHESLRVRGLLCRQCNLMIGNAKNDPQRLARAINYLLRF